MKTHPNLKSVAIRGVLRTLLLMAVSFGLSACEPKTDNTLKLYDHKTQYVGDNSKVSSIVHLQSYPKGVQILGIEILSQQEPFGLNVLIHTDQALKNDDLNKNAIITFALIDNLNDIYYIDSQNKNVVLHYHRNHSEQLLKQTGKSLAQISHNNKSLESYLKESQ